MPVNRPEKLHVDDLGRVISRTHSGSVQHRLPKLTTLPFRWLCMFSPDSKASCVAGQELKINQASYRTTYRNALGLPAVSQCFPVMENRPLEKRKGSLMCCHSPAPFQTPTQGAAPQQAEQNMSKPCFALVTFLSDVIHSRTPNVHFGLVVASSLDDLTTQSLIPP